VDVDALEEELRFHPDRAWVNDLLRGLKFGFDIGINEPPNEIFECKNLLSSKKEGAFVTAALKQEVDCNYIAGPFDSLPFTQYRVSPIGVATGKYSGKKRLILDLSAPHTEGEISSVNSQIDKDEYSLHYVTIDDAINVIRRLGKGSQLTKVDVKDAFRILPVAPHQWPHLCIKWEGQFYFYLRLPFGSRSSPKIFTMLSEAVHWIATRNYGIRHLLFLLDDFLVIDDAQADAVESKTRLLKVFDVLGVPLNQKKTAGPATTLEYLGIVLDTQKMEARLPVEKIERIRGLVRDMLGRERSTKRELLSLLGHLNFACRVVYHGRTFTSGLIKASMGVTELHHSVCISRACKDDLFMWARLLEQWNGVSMFHLGDCVTNIDLAIFTDSSSTIGFGGYNRVKGEAFMDTWINHPVPVTPDAMTYRELYPIVISCIVWGKQWERKRVKFMCDNEGTVGVLQKGRSRCENVNHLMRQLAVVATLNNFTFTAQWLSTKLNEQADALSRGNLSLFQTLTPKAVIIPCPAPRVVTCHSATRQPGTARRH
jgi:hypothetical protein